MLGDVTCGGDKFMSACGGNLGLIGVRGSMNSGKSSASSVGISKFSGWKIKSTELAKSFGVNRDETVTVTVCPFLCYRR